MVCCGLCLRNSCETQVHVCDSIHLRVMGCAGNLSTGLRECSRSECDFSEWSVTRAKHQLCTNPFRKQAFFTEDMWSKKSRCYQKCSCSSVSHNSVAWWNVFCPMWCGVIALVSLLFSLLWLWTSFSSTTFNNVFGDLQYRPYCYYGFLYQAACC